MSVQSAGDQRQTCDQACGKLPWMLFDSGDGQPRRLGGMLRFTL